MTQTVRMVQCVLLKKEAPGLERPVYPGDLGARIWRNVSKEAWQRWIAHQTMLINEYRLVTVEPKARKFLEAEMEKFLFGEGAAKPDGYVAPPLDGMWVINSSEDLKPGRRRRVPQPITPNMRAQFEPHPGTNGRPLIHNAWVIRSAEDV